MVGDIALDALLLAQQQDGGPQDAGTMAARHRRRDLEALSGSRG